MIIPEYVSLRSSVLRGKDEMTDVNNKEFFPGWEVGFGELVNCIVF